MTQAIYKYSLSVVGGPQVVRMPVGAKIVKVAPQHSQICLWAIVDTHPNASKMDFTFQIIGTGHPIPERSAYGATVFLDEYVLHVFALEGDNLEK